MSKDLFDAGNVKYQAVHTYLINLFAKNYRLVYIIRRPPLRIQGQQYPDLRDYFAPLRTTHLLGILRRHTNERERQQHVLLSDADAMSWRRALSVTPNQAKDTITKDKDVMDTWTLPGDDSNQGHTRHGTCSAVEEATGGEVAADDNRPALPGTESHRLVNDTAPRQDPKSSSLSVVAGDAALKEGGDGGDKTRETGSSAEKAIVEDRESPGKGGRDRGESFVCSVVPLSLALDQLRLNTVDLIKVDVEGDELAVLRGIDNYDWPNIRQVGIVVRGKKFKF